MSVKCFQHSSPSIVPRFFLRNLRGFRIRLQGRVWFGCFPHSTIHGLSRGLFHFEEEQKYTQCTLHKRISHRGFAKLASCQLQVQTKCLSSIDHQARIVSFCWLHTSQPHKSFDTTSPLHNKDQSSFFLFHSILSLVLAFLMGVLLDYGFLNSHEIFPSVNLSHIVVDRFIALFLILIYLLHFCCIR